MLMVKRFFGTINSQRAFQETKNISCQACRKGTYVPWQQERDNLNHWLVMTRHWLCNSTEVMHMLILSDKLIMLHEWSKNHLL